MTIVTSPAPNAAVLFGEFLLNDGPFAGAFTHIAFAVLDRQGETIAAFEKVFG